MAKYAQLAVESPAADGDTLVLSAILYHGDRPWTAPHALERPADGEPSRYPPGVFCYLLWNLMKLDLQDLPLPEASWAAVVAMAGAFDKSVRETLRDKVLLALPDDTLFQRQTLMYISTAWNIDRDVLDDRLKELKPKEGGDAMGQTLGDIAEDYLQEGRAEGEVRGMAKLLTQLLEQRFGALSAQQQEQLSRAKPEELADWSTRLFTAESLDGIFNGQ